MLRTKLNHLCAAYQYQVMLVTSALEGEGKSTVASNLAIVLAMDGKRVLLIDANLRSPVIHQVFNVSNNIALGDYLEQGILPEKLFHKKDNINLSIVPGNITRQDPSELLGSNSFKQFLMQARAEYDIILIDSPSIMKSTDALILSTASDGILLVVRAGRVKLPTLLKVKEEIEYINGKIIGTVMNSAHSIIA